MDYIEYRRYTCVVKITNSPITLVNLSSINLVSIFRGSGPPRHPVYQKLLEITSPTLRRRRRKTFFLLLLRPSDPNEDFMELVYDRLYIPWLKGDFLSEFTPEYTGSYLIGLQTPSGDIRDITLVDIWRRVMGRTIIHSETLTLICVRLWFWIRVSQLVMFLWTGPIFPTEWPWPSRHCEWFHSRHVLFTECWSTGDPLRNRYLH
jgi:hypothetical protein